MALQIEVEKGKFAPYEKEARLKVAISVILSD